MLNANSSREKQNEDQKAVDSVSGGARSQRAAGAGDQEGRHPAEDMLDGLGTKIGDRRKTLPSTQNARNDAEQVQVQASDKKIRILLQKKHNRTTMNVNAIEMIAEGGQTAANVKKHANTNSAKSRQEEEADEREQEKLDLPLKDAEVKDEVELAGLANE